MASVAHGKTDEATQIVADSARMPKVALTMAWWSICSAMFYIFLSAALARAYGTTNALIGITLSAISYGIINGILARYAIRTGLSCALLSELLFGSLGASVATAILCATAIYYAVFEGSVVAVAASRVIPHANYGIACIAVVLYSVPLVMGSVQRWLNRLNGALLPVYLIGLATICALTIHDYGYSNAWLHQGPPAAPASGWWNCFASYLGVWVLMMYTIDYARFGKRRDAQYHARLNFGVPFYLVAFLLNGLVGIFLVGTVRLAEVSETAVVDATLAVLGGLLGCAFVWVTQTRINTANYYVGTVNMQAFFERLTPVRLPKFVWAIVVGAIILALMRATDVFSYILIALAYQGIFVTAWVAVALTHILFETPDRQSAVALELNRVPRFNRAGLGAWFGGAVVGMLLLQAGSAAASAASAAAFGVSCLVYSLMPRRARTRSLPRH